MYYNFIFKLVTLIDVKFNDRTKQILIYILVVTYIFSF